tara:strand:+ start:546 stop:1145 length:600 start_codon:yes stop_codon:yes gene_type:complete
MDIILIGYFSEVSESLKEDGYNILGYIDFKKNNNCNNIKWLGSDEDALEVKQEFPDAQLIISPDLPHIRKKISSDYIENNFKIHSFLHSKAYLSKTSIIGNGTFIQNSSYISTNCKVGKLVKINYGANISHDCSIGDYTTVAPRAVILGNVSVGTQCYIGANCTVLPNVIIGDNVIIGAGSVVTRNIESLKTVKGSPAK